MLSDTYMTFNSLKPISCSFTITGNETPWDTLLYPIKNERLVPEIDKVVFSDPATIVMWKDGTKTVVKCGDKDCFDPEKGLAMAISKKALGNRGNYFDTFKEFIEEPSVEEEFKHDDTVEEAEEQVLDCECQNNEENEDCEGALLMLGDDTFNKAMERIIELEKEFREIQKRIITEPKQFYTMPPITCENELAKMTYTLTKGEMVK